MKSEVSFDAPVTSLSGVGGERSSQLARLGITTVRDLLLHAPRRYEDRRAFSPLKSLQPGHVSLCRGKVTAKGLKRFRSRRQSLFELVLDDGAGRLRCRWWNVPYMDNYFARGDEVVVFGKVLPGPPLTMDHPETEVVTEGEETLIHLNRIAPIYPLTEGLSQRWLRSLMFRTIESLLPENEPARKTGPLEQAIRNLGYPTHDTALRHLHFPSSSAEAERARARLALEETIQLQVRLLLRRRNFEAKANGIPCSGDNRLMRPFLAKLPFKLTAAQTAVLRELRQDLGGRYPMRRLLQGDVGSGKTVVAACAMLMAVESGFDAVLMAPTELLAEQHFAVFTRWFEPLGVPVELRTGARQERTDGSGPGLFVGTHALLHDGFEPRDLGLVVIDEQHRFGVEQRETLVRKGRYPHLLVMTATPIPRTLGLTLYGDLDVSVIHEKPPGRGRLKTYLRTPETLPRIWQFIREQLAQGRQAYVVYPRVEDGPAQNLKAAKKQLEVVAQALAPCTVALMHGRMPADEKEAVMTRFRKNEVQVLVATSLVEVGVDVPNASVMLIENAEAFGLAPLHQLRGRIGRGAHASFCILLAPDEPATQARLGVLTKSNDGFLIAEHDLRLRGAGDLLGHQQSGAPDFRFLDLTRDSVLVEQARQLAPLAMPAEHTSTGG